MNNITDLFCTPEVGKRYVTRGGWVTPPWSDYLDDYRGGNLEPIAEYVEPSQPDTFRRDLIARIYVMVVQETMTEAHYSGTECAEWAIRTADTLIEAMEGE